MNQNIFASISKPTLMDWAQIAEIMTSVGIIVSLVFVATTIESNNSLLSAEISDRTFDALRSVDELVLQDRTLLALTQKTKEELKNLDQTERVLYQEWVILNLDQWDRLYSRERDELITRNNLEAWEA